jgi:hypothetical protein
MKLKINIAKNTNQRNPEKFDVKILSVHFAFLERVRHKIEEKREKKKRKR